MMHTTKWQLFRFAIIYFSSQTSIFLIPVILESSNYQGWIALIAGCGLSLIILYFTIRTGSFRAGQAWLEFGKEMVGKWIHRLVVILLAWCVYYVSIDIENFVLFFGSNYLRGTPPLLIQCMIGLVILYSASLGLPTIIYMCDGIFMIFLASLALIFYLFIPNANMDMLPALIHYHDPVIAAKDSIVVLSWFAEWVVFLFVAPDLKIDFKIFKRLVLAVVAIFGIVLVGWILTLLNFGPYLGGDLKYPFLELVRSSSHNNLLSNIDPILIALWSSSMFIHSAFLIHIGTRCAAYVLKNRGSKYLSPVLTTAAVAIAFLYSRNVAIYSRDAYSFTIVLIWIGVGCIPVYYTLSAYIRQRVLKRN
ncbi:GerAB/ArcD/ProY family transporter [Paenibacillus sp. sgz500958]|uniref:GerAB/ArcD/ProY family transporter n=1 Tax=Paenibacillus sp. sgz500958 TaxID=3242475 RepID=UPI0036D2B29D